MCCAIGEEEWGSAHDGLFLNSFWWSSLDVFTLSLAHVNAWQTQKYTADNKWLMVFVWFHTFKEIVYLNQNHYQPRPGLQTRSVYFAKTCQLWKEGHREAMSWKGRGGGTDLNGCGFWNPTFELLPEPYSKMAAVWMVNLWLRETNSLLLGDSLHRFTITVNSNALLSVVFVNVHIQCPFFLIETF